MIRQRIIDLYIKLGTPVPVHGVAVKLGLSDDEFQRELAGTAKLAELGALRIDQAEELIRYYGSDLLFTTDIVEKVAQYRTVRRKLDRTEKKARDKGEPSSDR